jgi:hypothetical protein
MLTLKYAFWNPKNMHSGTQKMLVLRMIHPDSTGKFRKKTQWQFSLPGFEPSTTRSGAVAASNTLALNVAEQWILSNNGRCMHAVVVCYVNQSEARFCLWDISLLIRMYKAHYIF